MIKKTIRIISAAIFYVGLALIVVSGYGVEFDNE